MKYRNLGMLMASVVGALQGQNMNFYEKEVTYHNQKADISLSGTLTLPKGSGTYPAVILIAGYGPSDRDATGMGHKYFKLLAEHLTEQGIAVLRYDKRGVGTSTGNWAMVTTQELADDAFAGIAYLKTVPEINHKHIGVVGLSEGGLIAAMVASQSSDVAFAVLMAPYIPLGVDSVVYHTGLQLRADGASEEFIERDKAMRTAIYTVAQKESNLPVATQKIRELISEYLADLPESQKREAANIPWAINETKIDMWTNVLLSPSYRFFLTYDPIPMLESITVPVLVIAGNRDLTVSPNKIFPVIKKAFEKSGHKEYAMIELPNLNHCFQTCQTGALAEYAIIKETMAPIALKTISDWILKRVNATD